MRTARERLAAVPLAVDARDAFRVRLQAAEGDVLALADLMARAIDMARAAAGISMIGRDGRAAVSIEEVCASHCMADAVSAYRRARAGANS
jgi:hypothetical protein